MKKKGLIIATIVMVLVLAVSLTTATYAWFTTTSATTIESITVKAAAGADVKVGMKANNTYAAGASQDDFVSGQLQYGTGNPVWSGDPGMGFELVTGLSLASIEKATGYGDAHGATFTANAEGTYYKNGDTYTTTAPTAQTGATYEKCTVAGQPYTGLAVGDYIKYAASGTVGNAAKFVPGTSTGHSIVKASGTSSSSYDITSVAAAVENTDYLHFVIGLSPSVTGIDTITISLFVNPGTNKNAIGVEAALNCYYSTNGTTFTNATLYNTTDLNSANITYNTTKTNISAQSTVGAALNTLHTVETYTDSTVLNAGWKEIDVTFGTANTPMTVDTVYQVEFYIFYDGTDTDCINSALGSECGILFAITNTKASA